MSIGDTNALRRRTAEVADCGTVYDPAAVTPEVNNFDVVFDAVGAVASRKTAIECTRPGGVVVHVGLLQGDGPLDVRKLTLNEIAFVGAYTYSQSDLRAVARALYEGALGPLNWVERRPLEDGAHAFRELHEGQSAAAKIVLLP